jgi:glycosyltransferase involved in cell wall biosynthesis
VTRRARPLTVLYLDIHTGWRGGQRQVLWMAEGLRRRGGRPIFALRPGTPLAERARERAIEFVYVDPLFAEWGPWTVLRLRRLIRREGVQILHPQSGHTMALAALARIGTGARIVFARRVASPLRKNFASRWKYGSADRVISVSHAGMTALLEVGLDPTRIEVVPSGIDLARRVTPASTQTLAALGVPAGAPLVVTVGAMTAQKDPLTFVRTMAVVRRAVPPVQALLVGEGPLRGPVEELIRQLGLGDAVHLTGFRTDTESLIAASDVTCLSSVQEGTPGVLIDALSLGRPVAATSGGGTPEVVEDGVTGLLAPVGDSERLGAAIARLLTDRSLASRLAAAGRVSAARFSIEQTIERTVEVYERLLDGESA